MLPKTKQLLVFLLGGISLALLGTSSYFYYQSTQTMTSTTKAEGNKPSDLFSPLVEDNSDLELKLSPQDGEETTPNPPSTSDPADYHILFLGTDKRTPSQTSYRTDAILLVSILKDEKRALLTSIPRDLWLSGTKINAHFANEGFDKFKQRINKVSGLEPDYFVSTGFEGFVWSINRLGGTNPDIKRSFTDLNYPPDRPDAPHPPTFQAGVQNLNAEETLAYCRSRKGTGGEGSDFQRMRRQQNLMVSLPGTFKNSDLIKLTAEALYNLFIGHIQTNIGVGEAAKLLAIVKDWENYTVDHLVLDTNNFLYHPPMSEYGGAYVLRPRGGSFDEIKAYIASKL